MAATKKKNNPGYVTRSECQQISKGIKDELHEIKVAIVGEDMQGGLVKAVHDLTKNQSLTKELVKSVGVPILVAVVVAWIVSGMPH